ncbi:MAG: SlyX family protein [Deltaproteobacteria bacterium]|jgi:SlyX protein
MEDRITDLELRYTHQQDLIEKLDAELLGANRTIDVLQKRVERLEHTLEQVLAIVDVPTNEKPPHY